MQAFNCIADKSGGSTEQKARLIGIRSRDLSTACIRLRAQFLPAKRSNVPRTSLAVSYHHIHGLAILQPTVLPSRGGRMLDKDRFEPQNLNFRGGLSYFGSRGEGMDRDLSSTLVVEMYEIH